MASSSLTDYQTGSMTCEQVLFVPMMWIHIDCNADPHRPPYVFESRCGSGSRGLFISCPVVNLKLKNLFHSFFNNRFDEITLKSILNPPQKLYAYNENNLI